MCVALCWRLIYCTEASVNSETVRGSDSVASPRSHAAPLSVRGGEALSAAKSAERAVSSCLPAPSD